MAGYVHIIFFFTLVFQVSQPGEADNGRCSSAEIEVFESGVPKKTEPHILSLINKVRESVTHGEILGEPQAKKLNEMKYSAKLSKLAQENADKCIIDSEKMDQTVLAKFSAHEQTAGADWESTINYWISTRKHFVYPNETIQLNAAMGYLHLVDEKALEVGCGFKHFSDMENKLYPYVKYYVCNFDSVVDIHKAPYDAVLDSK